MAWSVRTASDPPQYPGEGELISKFAILIPIFLSPIIGSLLWAQHQVRRRKRNKLIRPHLQRCVCPLCYLSASAPCQLWLAAIGP